MAFRYLIYRTDFGNTIVRESPTDTSTGGTEQSLFSDFVIPGIQPLYLWRVSGGTSVIPNIDTNIDNWLSYIAPPIKPNDNATVGFVTGITETKIDKVTGATDNLGVFDVSGNLVDAGYTIPELTGLTTYTFVESGGTTISQIGNTITIYSATPTGTTVAWGDITGDISNQTDLWNIIVNITGDTANKLDTSIFNAYSATTQPVIDSALTGVTNLGTGTTLLTTSGRNVQSKSISVLGGLSITGDVNNIIISGQTGGTGSSVWGDITGTLSDQTDLWNTLTGMTAETANKLDTTVFINYSAVTDLRLDGIDANIVYLSGQTDLRLTISDFNSYTGTTETRLQGIENDITGLTATKLNISDFNSYTGTTETRLQGIESDIVALSASSAQAITGATNGLTKSGQDVILGGNLTQNTTISGTTFDFAVNTAAITLQATGIINVIDTSGSGINVESDGGSIDIIGNTSLGVERTKLTINETSMLITDSRVTPTGIQYAADYSTNFVNESLVSKRYVDSVASGLIPKANVQVATTTNIDLSGGTFGGTIDGETVLDSWRVLIKNQTNAEENGIYVYSGGSNTFYRSTDFDGSLVGEVTDGNIIPVLSGSTLYNTVWILVTPNPIIIGATELEFTLFSQPHQLIGGVGISITGNTISVDGASLAGNSLAWTGNTFNVDVSSGDLASTLATKLNISDFNSYSATTDSRISNVESDIVSLSAETANKLETTTFNTYTGVTETRLQGIESDITYISGVTDTKLDSSIFTGYTASTVTNEIFLVHTGGTDLNTILATGIDWDYGQVTGTSFSWTGGSDITILETGEYEVNFNIPFNSESNSDIAIGANLILNNSADIDISSTAGNTARNLAAGAIVLSPIRLQLNANDILTLATFRTSQSGTATSSESGSILIKKKNTLQ